MALGAERVLEVALQSCIPSVASFTPHHRNHKPVFQVRKGGKMQAERSLPSSLYQMIGLTRLRKSFLGVSLSCSRMVVGDGEETRG